MKLQTLFNLIFILLFVLILGQVTILKTNINIINKNTHILEDKLQRIERHLFLQQRMPKYKKRMVPPRIQKIPKPRKSLDRYI